MTDGSDERSHGPGIVDSECQVTVQSRNADVPDHTYRFRWFRVPLMGVALYGVDRTIASTPPQIDHFTTVTYRFDEAALDPPLGGPHYVPPTLAFDPRRHERFFGDLFHSKSWGLAEDNAFLRFLWTKLDLPGEYVVGDVLDRARTRFRPDKPGLPSVPPTVYRRPVEEVFARLLSGFGCTDPAHAPYETATTIQKEEAAAADDE